MQPYPILETLFRHNLWANLQLLEVCRPLSEEQLQSRRANAALEVRNNPNVAFATWQTKSTLELRLNAVLDDKALDALVQYVCSVLLEREELRYTRLQLEVPSNNPGQPFIARWRQCR